MKTQKTIHVRMASILHNIKNRCSNPRSTRYERYGGRGIKNMLIRKDLLYLWMRDGAEKMKNPSIDRVNNDGNYILNNCRFIELSENIKRATTYKNLNIICLETGERFSSFQEVATKFGRKIRMARDYFYRKSPAKLRNFKDGIFYTLKRNLK